jgi:hypothetical protein
MVHQRLDLADRPRRRDRSRLANRRGRAQRGRHTDREELTVICTHQVMQQFHHF